MTRSIRLLLCAAWFTAFSSPLLAQDCNRACLADLLDRYLEAVVANDPEAAPIAVGIRQTENAVNFAPGAGPWQSVTALGEVQRRYYDPVSGQAAYYGSVEERGEGALVTARIRVEGRQITEAEWYIARADDPGLSGPRQPGRPPANLLNSEWFFIDAAKIRTVYTAMFYPEPTLAVPNWPPYWGNWPLPATTVPEQ